MKIAIDACGGDHKLTPNVLAAVKHIETSDIEIVLVGKDEEIKKELKKLGYSVLPPKLKIVNASQEIEMGKEPVDECKNKPNSSIMVGCELLAEKQVDAFISAGNSGAVMVASLMKIGRIKGVSRPAIAVPFPTRNGTSLILDAGANTDVKPFNLVQFAVMGSAFFKNVMGKENPTVGILSIGEEETKGNTLVLESIPLLKNLKHINFIGPVEGRDIPDGKADVIICDGFVGNIVLKLSEGIARFVKDFFYQEISKSVIKKIGALMIKDVFRSFKDKTDPEKFGGAPLIGIDGVVIICHGNSTEKAIYNAVLTAKEAVEKEIIKKTKIDLENILEKIEK